MKKKILLSILFLALSLLFSISYTFAANDMVNGVRDVVGGAENVVEDAASGVATGIRQGTNTLENMGRDMTTTDINNGYTAERTSARMATNNYNNATFLGMNSNLWIWLTFIILGAAIIGLVWYYGKQFDYNSNNNDNY